MQTIADVSLFGADIFMESNKQKLTKVFIFYSTSNCEDPEYLDIFVKTFWWMDCDWQIWMASVLIFCWLVLILKDQKCWKAPPCWVFRELRVLGRKLDRGTPCVNFEKWIQWVFGLKLDNCTPFENFEKLPLDQWNIINSINTH